MKNELDWLIANISEDDEIMNCAAISVCKLLYYINYKKKCHEELLIDDLYVDCDNCPLDNITTLEVLKKLKEPIKEKYNEFN